jgi:hypothetical protein
MKYFNGFHPSELSISVVPLHYINAFITGLKPEIGFIWDIYLMHVYICKLACKSKSKAIPVTGHEGL